MNKYLIWLKLHWRLASIAAGGILVAVSAAVALIIMGGRQQDLRQGANANQGTVAEAPVPAVETYADLYAVSIDNHPDARPSSGLAEAAVVYEAPVEGGITRFLALFERGKQVAQIGPVRSARPYFIDWAKQWGSALFFHYGGSPEAMGTLASSAALREINVDGTGAGGASFWRDDSRQAPHNAYTSSENAEKVFAARAGGAHQVSAWLAMPDPAMDLRGTDATRFEVRMSKDAAFNPSWKYDRNSNSYARIVGGKPAADRDGKAIAAKDIVVIKADTKVLDSEGRLQVETAGTGAGTLYRDGSSRDIVWKAAADGGPVRLYHSDGSEAVLTAGNVWIEVSPN